MKPSMEQTTLVILLFSGLSSLFAYYSREYYLVNMKMNWTAAQSYCRETFDDLATIDNDYDNQRLLSLSLNTNVTADDIWIGLYDDINIWKWSMEGKNFNFHRDAGFITWMKGQPNNKNGNQYCVVYYNSKELNDITCEEFHAFICYDDNSTTNYVLVNEQLTWPQAQMYCREHHRDLVSIRNQEENDNILNTLTASGFENTWIGLYRDPWAFWSDKSTSKFTNWQIGKPNNMFGMEYCAAFYAVSGEWTDENCGKMAPFFCFKGVTRQTILKLKTESDAYMYSTDIQQQILQQLDGHIASSGITYFKIYWRDVQIHCRKKEDRGEVTAQMNCDWI